MEKVQFIMYIPIVIFDKFVVEQHFIVFAITNFVLFNRATIQYNLSNVCVCTCARACVHVCVCMHVCVGGRGQVNHNVKLCLGCLNTLI